MRVQREAIWTLVVPDDLLAGVAQWPRRWALSRMLGDSITRRLPFRGLHGVIGWAVTGHAAATSAWAPAPVTWMADFREEPPLGAIRIDPVWLTSGPRGLSVTAPAQLALGAAEAGRLAAAVAAGFRERGVGVRVARPDRWYMTLPAAPEVRWWPPEDLPDRSLLDLLPAGDAGADLRRMLNEIQMILHDQPDNVARRERGAPEANSVWPWGWSQRPLPRVRSVADKLYADHPYARGLAGLSGTAVAASAAGPDDLPPSGVVIPEAPEPEYARWLESAWAGPLRRAALKGNVAAVRWVTPGGRVAEYQPRPRWKLWRSRKSSP